MPGAVLLDTHIWVHSFAREELLTAQARDTITQADRVYVSPISFFEIGQKIRIGKWPEMEPFADALADILHEQGGIVAPFSPQICLTASMMDWSHRDPFDRLLVTTAKLHNMALITEDVTIRDFVMDKGEFSERTRVQPRDVEF